ncbi:MAG TPA: tetratricopeptide repeat protein [Acidobacteria bacterium]|nr:tetratricopeptide repeat protein [Acidobacteriota bacterium]
MRRLLTTILVFLTAVMLVLPLAEASRGDKKKRRSKRARAEQSFTLESELLAQVPAVAAALAYLDDNTDKPDAWRALGVALTEFGAYSDAVNAFERGLELDPDNAKLWVDLGAARIRAEEFRKGLKALNRALKIEPFMALAHYNAGVAYRALGKWEAAMEAFEKALLLDPDLGDPKKNPGAVNTPELGLVKLRVFMKTSGAAPAILTSQDPTADK